jgi:hypothetical protein
LGASSGLGTMWLGSIALFRTRFRTDGVDV